MPVQRFMVSSLPRFSGRVVCLTRRLPAPACGAVKPWSDRTREATRSAGLDSSAAWVPTMQPMAGTRPAREEAADTDDWTGPHPASDTTCPDRDHGPQTARPRSPASARPGLATGLTVECFGDRVGDMRLYRPRGTSAPNLAPTRPTWPPSPRRPSTDRRPAARSRRAATPRPAAPRRRAGARRGAAAVGGRGRSAGRPGTRRRADRTSDETASNALTSPRTTSTTNTTTTRSTTSPTARPLSRYLTFPSSLASPRDRPLTALPVLLLPAHPHARPPPACRRPASGPPAYAWAALPDLSGRSRKGGPARSGGPPFLESPGVKRNLGPEAGRRPVRLLRRTPRDEHLETNTQRRTPRGRGQRRCRCAEGDA